MSVFSFFMARNPQIFPEFNPSPITNSSNQIGLNIIPRFDNTRPQVGPISVRINIGITSSPHLYFARITFAQRSFFLEHKFYNTFVTLLLGWHTSSYFIQWTYWNYKEIPWRRRRDSLWRKIERMLDYREWFWIVIERKAECKNRIQSIFIYTL